MLRFVEPSGEVSVFRERSNNSNGNTIDNQGRLVTCEHLTRRVTRTEIDGSISVIAEKWNGRRLNSPNDVVVKSDDSIWFTDPAYGIDTDYEGDRAGQEIEGCNVYRVDPKSGAVAAVITDMVRPNGIAFSPDEKYLYVADTGRRTKRTVLATFADTGWTRTGPSCQAAKSSPSPHRDCSTVFASTGMAVFGRAAQRASIAMRSTVR